MSLDQLASFSKIKATITRKFGSDMWKLVCFDDALGDSITLFNLLTDLNELKLNVLTTFGESTWRFLLTDEFSAPVDDNGDFIQKEQEETYLHR